MATFRKKDNHATFRNGAGAVYSSNTVTDNKGIIKNVRDLSELNCKIPCLRFRNSYSRQSDLELAERYTTKHEKKIVVNYGAPVCVGDFFLVGDVLYRIYYTDPDYANKELYIFLEKYRKLENG